MSNRGTGRPEKKRLDGDTACEFRKPFKMKSGTRYEGIVICHGNLEFVGYLKSMLNNLNEK
jgi:hypothetical protein